MRFVLNSKGWLLFLLLYCHAQTTTRAATAADCCGGEVGKFQSFQDKTEVVNAIGDYLRSSQQQDMIIETYGPINCWDVSAISDMSGLFILRNFNEDISCWDVSSVTDMSGMFWSAISFDGDISNWNVSSVTDMDSMFFFANSFNGDLSSWDVSSVTNMFGMFSRAFYFNGDLSSWDVSSVTNMNVMFSNVISFNGDLSNWDVSSVTGMAGMFRSTSFNGDLSNWDVSSVISMRNMFHNAASFNGDLSNWDVSSVIDTTEMFASADSFDQSLCNWGPKLQGRAVLVEGMFVNTKCPYPYVPDLTIPNPNPLCRCCQTFCFHPTCYMCVRGEYNPATDDDPIISIPVFNFLLTCYEANFGGLSGLLGPDFCEGIRKIGATGQRCGCTEASWPELVGRDGKEAVQMIGSETTSVTAIVVATGSPVPSEFDIDRVWVWVSDEGGVAVVPEVG